MSYEFIVPMTKDDLLNRTTFSQYVVDEIYTLRQLPMKIQDYKNFYRSKGPHAILERFDTLFSILMNFHDADASLREEAYDMILKGIMKHTNELPHFIDDILEKQDRVDNLNIVKMHCYLLCQFIEMFEAENSKPGITTGKGRGKAQKRPDNLRWDHDCERGVHALLKIVQQNIYRLWDPPVIEEEFVNMLTTCCYKLLENPAINRNKAVRDIIFNIIGIMVKKYNHALSATLKIIQLLQHFEHMVGPLSQAVELFVNEYGAHTIVGEIMREIGRMDTRDLARDSSGTHAFAQFMVELAEKVPAVMLPNMSVIIPQLDEEPYTMRNGVLGVMGEILIQTLSKDNLDNKQKATRDTFLDKLEEHIHDVNAFVRSKTLQIWLNIVKEKALPLTRQADVVDLVIGRLQDKSSQVRKYAMQLVVALMKSNPFAAKLSIEELTASYEKERDKLKEMMPDAPPEPVVDPTTAALEVWTGLQEGVEVAVIEVVEEGRTPNNDLIDDEDTALGVMKKITAHLKNHEIREAVVLLQVAKEAFTEEPMLMDAPADEEDGEEGERVERNLVDTMKAVFMACSIDRVPSISSPGGGESQNPMLNEIHKQQVLVQYLKDCVTFISQIQKAVQTICQLLGSKITTDILEAIQFFVTSFEFGVMNAMIGVRRMLALVWSKEGGIKDAVVNAYRRLYLCPSEGNQRTKAIAVVKNLTALTQGASKGELTSLEELIQEFVRSGDINQSVIKVLWEKFAMKIPATTSDESRAALVLLGMAAGAEEGIAESNIKVLVQEGLGDRGEQSLILAKDACAVLLKLGGAGKPKAGSIVEPYKLPQDHDMFIHLQHLIVRGFKNGEDPYWIPFTEQAINVIYKLAEHPDVIATNILRSLVAAIAEQTAVPTETMETVQLSAEGETEGQGEEKETQDSEQTDSQTVDKPEDSEPTSSQSSQGSQALTQPELSCPAKSLTMLVSLAGHCALRQLIHLDVAVFGELKRRHQVQEEQAVTKKKRSLSAATPRTKESVAETIEEEMGLAGAAAEDAEAEYIRKICETDIVNGENFLAILRPVIVTICNNPKKYYDPDLQTAATLALAKFMLVSSEFCEDHLQLLFTILEKSPNPVIRGNTIISLGDLTFRFPNLIEPWTQNLYARLRDDSPQVRRNTLMVLTHLILNDMVKVKGQISEMATCIMDNDPRISSLAKLFFLELAKKGNAVYNIMPDMVSRLSDLDVGVTEESFRTIMKYLFGYISKDRQCESLVEKLCHRFRATRSERQWRDIAFCLSLLTYSERSIRKLTENFACYGDKLADNDVFNSFCVVLTASKKFAKADIKALVEELEVRIEECHCKGLNDEEVADKAKKASQAAKAFRQARSPRGRGRSPPTARKTRQGLKKEILSDDDIQPTQQHQGGRKQRPKLRFSSSEDSDLELFDVDDSQKDSECQKSASDSENHDPGACKVESLEAKVVKSAKKQKPTVKSGSTRRTPARRVRSVRT